MGGQTICQSYGGSQDLVTRITRVCLIDFSHSTSPTYETQEPQTQIYLRDAPGSPGGTSRWQLPNENTGD